MAARAAFHYVRHYRVGCQGAGRHQVGHHVHPQKHNGGEREISSDGKRQDDEYLAQAGREQIVGKLADVIEDPATFFNGSHDGGKVIVQQDHGGGFLGDIRTAQAHRNAHVRLFQGGRIVDPIPGHGHHVSGVLQCLQHLLLHLGRGTRHDIHFLHFFDQRWSAEAAHLTGIHDASPDPERLGDGLGGQTIVAGDHHHPDAGSLGACNGFGGSGTRRIDQSQQPHEGHFVFCLIGRNACW